MIDTSTATETRLLPVVDFCGLDVARLIIGANPFGGFSHQSPERNEEMLTWSTVERIIETWRRAESAGINTMVTNNESEHVVEAVKKYFASGATLQWIAQLNNRKKPSMRDAVDEVVDIGCSALFFHGALVDGAYSERDEVTIRSWVEYARSKGVPVGVAGHAPEAHIWVDSLDVVDFHVVCFFNCGSLHEHKGDKFRLADMAKAVDAINRIQKPCIGYKIMGAGRIDPVMAFEYAFENIKPGDVVNVGMHRGDKDDIVEENAGIVRRILNSE